MKSRIKVALTALLFVCCAAVVCLQVAPVYAQSSGTITSVEMINAVANAGKDESGGYGKSIENDFFSYRIGYGKVGDTIDYTAYEVSAAGLRTSAVYSGTYNSSVLLTGGTARIANYKLVDGAVVKDDFNILYVLQAKKDISLEIAHGARNNSSNKVVAKIWKSGDTLTLLQAKPVPNGEVAANSLGGTFQVKQGETLVFEFALADDVADKYQCIFYGALFPSFNASEASGTEQGEDISEYKAEKLAELRRYIQNIDNDAYYPSTIESIEEKFENFRAAIESLTEKSDIDLAFENAKTAIAVLLNNAPIISATLKTTDMVGVIYKAGKDENGVYGAIGGNNLVSYDLSYGSVADNEWHYYEDATATPLLKTKSIISSYQGCAGWMIRVGNCFKDAEGVKYAAKANMMYRFTAKQNILLNISNPAVSSSSKNVVANIYILSGDLELVKTTVLGGALNADELGGLYRLAENEQLIFEFAVSEEATTLGEFNIQSMLPVFTVYDSAALSMIRDKTVQSLTSDKNAVKAEDYSEVDYNDLIAAYTSAIEQISNITDISEISQIGVIKNRLLAQVADIFSAVRASVYRTELEDKLRRYIANIDKNLYLEETYAAFADKVTELTQTIATITRKSAMDTAYEQAVQAINNVEKDAPVSELTASLSDLIGGVVAKGKDEKGRYSEWGNNQLFAFRLGYGRVFVNFGCLEMDGYESYSDGLVTNYVYNNNNDVAGGLLENGTIVFSDNYMSGGKSFAKNINAVLMLKAKSELKFTLGHGEISAFTSTKSNNIVVRIWRIADGKAALLKETDVTSGAEANAYGGEFFVNTDDLFVIEYSVDGSGYSLATLSAPTIKAEKTEEVQPPVTENDKQQLNADVFRMISEQTKYGAAEIAAEGVKWELLHGTVENNVRFEIVCGDILRTERLNASTYNSVYAANSYNKFIRTDPKQGENFIIKIIATDNVHIHIGNEAWVKGSHSLGGTYTAVVAHYDETDEKWYYLEVGRQKLEWVSEIAENLIDIDLHLMRGDILYYVLSGANHETYLTFTPSFGAKTAEYDEAKKLDMTAFIEAQRTLDEVKATLTQEYGAIDSAQYTTDDYLSICELYELALGTELEESELEKCKSKEEITSYVVALHEKINDFVKITEAEAVRKTYYDKFTAELNKLDESKYTKETWDTVLGYEKHLADELNRVTKRSEMQELLNTELAKLAAVSPDANQNTSGCYSSINESILLFAAISVIVVLIKKRREKPENIG